MEEIGIKQIARRVGKFVETHLIDEEVCATVIGNDIVLCMRHKPAYIVTGQQFSTDTPRRLLTAGINIINRMLFDLSPGETSAIVASTVSKIVGGETQAGGGRLSQCLKNKNHEDGAVTSKSIRGATNYHFVSDNGIDGYTR